MYTMVLFGVSLLVHPMPRCAYITDWLGLVPIVQEEILAYTGLWLVSLEFSFKGKKILWVISLGLVQAWLTDSVRMEIT